MKERLEKLIAEARREYFDRVILNSTSKDGKRVSEAAFLAEALIEAGVCFRLEIPRWEETARRCATCVYEEAFNDRCMRCVGHELWEGKTNGKCN